MFEACAEVAVPVRCLCLEAVSSRGLTPKQEVDLARFEQEDAERQDALRRLAELG